MAVTTGCLERPVPGERAALELVEVTAHALIRSASELGRTTDVALPTFGQRVLPVERKRMREMRRRPTFVVVATAALQRIEISLHLHVERRLCLIVVGAMTGNAVRTGKFHVGHLEIFGTFTPEPTDEAEDAQRQAEDEPFHGDIGVSKREAN